jgi:hypothetical protein
MTNKKRQLKKRFGENRARLINAMLIMESTPGNGTRMRIELPI